MYAFCVYPAMSKKSENLSDLNKKDRNKRHSSPFIIVIKGVFFVVPRYISTSFILVCALRCTQLQGTRKVYSQAEKFIRLVRIKQKFIRIAYLYSNCTDCRIKSLYTSYKSIKSVPNTTLYRTTSPNIHIILNFKPLCNFSQQRIKFNYWFWLFCCILT